MIFRHTERQYRVYAATFNPRPTSSRGFELGTDPNCDIILPRLKYISRVHCALTFDDQRRLILRNFSKHGTIVKYNEKGGELRRTIVTYDDKRQEIRHHFKWILGGHKVPRDTENIVIEIQGISFRIIVSTHDTHPQL
ncbi:MAG: hypothetical protein MMC33_000573 [Icmadophila ericetorum]|nr:hypothetical protein [Icmadophila ericetorum]